MTARLKINSNRANHINATHKLSTITIYSHDNKIVKHNYGTPSTKLQNFFTGTMLFFGKKILKIKREVMLHVMSQNLAALLLLALLCKLSADKAYSGLHSLHAMATKQLRLKSGGLQRAFSIYQ